MPFVHKYLRKKSLGKTLKIFVLYTVNIHQYLVMYTEEEKVSGFSIYFRKNVNGTNVWILKTTNFCIREKFLFTDFTLYVPIRQRLHQASKKDVGCTIKISIALDAYCYTISFVET